MYLSCMGTISVSEMLNTFEETFEVTEMRTFKHEPFLITSSCVSLLQSLQPVL